MASGVAQAGAPAAARNYIDAYYVPQSKVTFDTPGVGPADDNGTGFGIRSLSRVGDALAFTGDYQKNAYGKFSLDTKSTHLGLGVVNISNSGVFLEYVKGTRTSPSGGGSADRNGYALRGRLATDGAESLQFYGDLAYQKLKGDKEDFTGYEFSVGAVAAVSATFGLFLDYRLSYLEGSESKLKEKYGDLRGGLRITLGG